MRFTILAVGGLREKPFRLLADDYLARIRRTVRCDEIEVRDRRELERRWPVDGTVVALEVDGESMGSPKLAQYIERWGCQGQGQICWVIGAADGIPVTLSARATNRLSLSSLTLPHRLARVVLYEQLYRSLTILRGEPYAREG